MPSQAVAIGGTTSLSSEAALGGANSAPLEAALVTAWMGSDILLAGHVLTHRFRYQFLVSISIFGNNCFGITFRYQFRIHKV